MNLKSMSIDKLTKLKGGVDAALATKVVDHRRNLEAQLAQLSRFDGRMGGKRGGARGKVAPKYRNPENPSETWAGRGLRPRWLVAALKSGKKLEQLAIAASAKTSAVKKSPRKKKK
jgi:DNA-binding protein H-NS